MKLVEVQKQRLRFDVEGYKQRLGDAIKAKGGPTAFAEVVGVSYQVVQGWAKGSIPRAEDWPSIEKSGSGMAWYLFALDDMATDRNLDRKAAMAVIADLRKQLNTLETIVREPATDKRVEGAGFSAEGKKKAAKYRAKKK